MTSEAERHPESTADLAAALDRPASDREARRDEQSQETLLAPERADALRERWMRVQGEFVDGPREAVRQADALVAEIIGELARQFSDARSGLEQQWESDRDVDTEDLRLALQQYRSFMERLLAA